MWKFKRKLIPKENEAPTAKKDENGSPSIGQCSKDF